MPDLPELPERPDHRSDDSLRALFDDAVADVEPAPALHRIQRRVRDGAGTSGPRPWLYAAGAAVLATAATLLAVFVIAPDPTTPRTTGPAASTSDPAPTDGSAGPDGALLPASPPTTPPASPSQEQTGSTSTPGGGTVAALPVYYVADTPVGPRLFREFHRQQVAGGTVEDLTRAALTESAGGSPLDPDYRTDWPDGTAAVTATMDRSSGDPVITVDLTSASDLAARPAGTDAVDARMAVQQLVFTAQAGFATRAPVRFLLDGAQTPSLLGVAAADPVTQGALAQVQGSVWVTSPQDGDRVGRTFTVEGRGAFFEAHVAWQLLGDGEVVQEGFTTAEECCALAPYAFTVEQVEPGDYVLRVYDADVSGGEGNGEAEDTKRITVR